VAVKWGEILSEISGFSIATQRILVWSQIWDQGMKERLELHSLRTDHVTIRSELKYLIRGKVVRMKCLVVGGKTGPFPTGRVFREVRPSAMVRCRVEPDPEPTREFGPVANTTNAAIDSSTLSLWNSGLSISSANLRVKISFILIFWQQLSSDNSSDSSSNNSWQRLGSDSSSDSSSDSGWAPTTTLKVALTAAELGQQLSSSVNDSD